MKDVYYPVILGVNIQIHRIVTLTLGALCVANISSQAAPAAKAKISTFNLTEADANKTLAVKTGDFLVLRLKSNASTGYSWTPAAGTGKGLTLQGKGEYIQPKSTGTPMPGAPGEQLWRFKAIRKGQTSLKLNYTRPWEKGIAPAQTWGVILRIK